VGRPEPLLWLAFVHTPTMALGIKMHFLFFKVFLNIYLDWRQIKHMVDNLKLAYLYRNEFDKSLEYLTNFSQEILSTPNFSSENVVWSAVSDSIIKAICLNSISKNICLNTGKLYLLICDEEKTLRSLAEFIERFSDKDLEFRKYIETLTKDSLQGIIDILKRTLESQIPYRYTIYHGNDIWLRSLLGSYHDINSEIIVNENLHPQYTTTSEREYKKGYLLSLALYRILELYQENPNIMNENNKDFTMLCNATEFNLNYLTTLPDKYSYVYNKIKSDNIAEDDSSLSFSSKVNIPSHFKRVIPKFIQSNSYPYLNSCLSRMMNTKYHKLFNYTHSIPDGKINSLKLIYDITNWNNLDSVLIEGHCIDNSYIGTFKTIEYCDEDLYVRLHKLDNKATFIKNYNNFHYDSFRISCAYKGCDVCMCFIEDKIKVSISAFEGFEEEAKEFFNNLSKYLETCIVY
jgi:hypothetical protein